MTSQCVISHAPSKKFCTICQNPILAGEPVRTCDCCNSAFHDACWAGTEGCGTYGCTNAPHALKVILVQESKPGAWGDTKICPNCGQVLESAALKCRHCKANFDTRAPMSAEDYRHQLARETARRRFTWLASMLFFASAIGVAAPLTLALGVVWLRLRGQVFVRRAACTPELLVYGAIALSVAYSLLLSLVFVAGW